MNTTKKADRDKWIARAAQLMHMDADTRVTNKREVMDMLTAEFGISQGSARTALMHASMRRRHEMLSH